MKMKELPISERPYEKLEMYGEKSLSNAELIAIIIKSGTRNECTKNSGFRKERRKQPKIFAEYIYKRIYEY